LLCLVTTARGTVSTCWQAALNGIESVKKNAPGAEVDDLTAG